MGSTVRHRPAHLQPADREVFTASAPASERAVGHHRHVVHPAPVAPLLDVREVLFHDPQVRGAEQVRAGHQFLEALQPDEPDVAVERKIHLVRVEDVEQNDLVPAEAEVPQGRENWFQVFEAIRDQAHDAAAADAVGDLVQERPDGGAVPRFGVFERVRDGVDVPPTGWRAAVRPPTR